MDKPIAKSTKPVWLRNSAIAAILLITAALVLGACAPRVQPEESAAVEPSVAPTEAMAATDTANTAAGDSADATPEDTSATEQPASDTAAADTPSENPADYFAADGEPTEEYDGVPVGLTVSGLPYKGDPNAPILLVEYSDYQCPYCGRHFNDTEPSIFEQYVQSGDVRTVFVEFPLAQLHPQAPAAHASALCVLEQGSVADYWKMHNALFSGVNEWSGNQDAQSIFNQYAEDIGVDMDAFNACVENGDTVSQVNDRVSFAQSQGFGGTPSFQIIRTEDGLVTPVVGAQPFTEFSSNFDLLLSGGTPEAAGAQAEAQIPFWATKEGWQPDPDRPGFDMAGDQYKGELDAPITVIEFSDFECPYCQQHALETQPTLDEQYVDTGKALWIFKHFPLADIHPSATMGAAAAECATGQGKFWEYEHLLFEKQDEWTIGDTEAALTSLAEEVGMDPEIFQACINDPAIAEAVNSDLTDGAPFVRGTPAFIVLHGEQGSIIPGALPLESFTQILDDVLAGNGG